MAVPCCLAACGTALRPNLCSLEAHSLWDRLAPGILGLFVIAALVAGGLHRRLGQDGKLTDSDTVLVSFRATSRDSRVRFAPSHAVSFVQNLADVIVAISLRKGASVILGSFEQSSIPSDLLAPSKSDSSPT
jgi:hypothetical protein